jgi:16S rRNA C1402 (ribose-2'-O) methylase RsmI
MTALEKLREPQGEFTVVVDIGHKKEYALTMGPDAAAIVLEFGAMTKSAGISRRQAVAALSKSHGLRPNEVYAMIEAAKKSGE